MIKRVLLLCSIAVLSLALFGCNRGGDEPPLTGGEHQGTYGGTYSGSRSGQIAVSVDRLGSFTAQWADGEMSGYVYGRVRPDSRIFVETVEPEGADFNGAFLVEEAGGELIFPDGSKAQWHVTKGVYDLTAYEGLWFGNVMILGSPNEDDGRMWIEFSAEGRGDAHIASTISGAGFQCVLASDGRIVGSNQDNTLAIIANITGNDISGSWYDYDAGEQGTFWLQESELREAGDDDLTWVGSAPGGGEETLSLNLLDSTSGGDIRVVLLGPDGGAGHLGRMDVNGNFLASSIDEESAVWGTADVEGGAMAGYIADRAHNVSGIFTGTKVAELMWQAGQWNGQYYEGEEKPDPEEGEEVEVETGELIFLVDGAGFAMARILITDGDAEEDAIYMTGRFDAAGSFQGITDDGTTVYQGDFSTPSAEGTWDRNSGEMTGGWEADWS